MSSDRTLLIIALILNAALYTGGVLVTALVWNRPTAAILALVTFALCYISPLVQMMSPPLVVSAGVVFASIVAGAWAGLSLFW